MLIVCPTCRSRLRIGDDLLDREIRCPSCNTVARIGASPGRRTGPKVESDDDPPLAMEIPLHNSHEIEDEDDEDIPRPRRYKRKRANSNLLIGVTIVGAILLGVAAIGGTLWWLLGPETNSNLTPENTQKIKAGMTLEEAEAVLGKARPATDNDIAAVTAKINEVPRIGRPPDLPPLLVRATGTRYVWRNKNHWFFVDVDNQSKKIVGITGCFFGADP